MNADSLDLIPVGCRLNEFLHQFNFGMRDGRYLHLAHTCRLRLGVHLSALEVETDETQNFRHSRY